MAYKYSPIISKALARKGNTPKNDYTELFQRTLDEQFYNASNWWTIQEETEIGSQTYADIDVRIAHVINTETGLKLGDDWKTLLFQDVSHDIEIGKLYIFDESTWITVNIEKDKNLTGTCTIRRCNNTLRWIDEATGAIYEEPCAIEYLVKEPRDYMTQGSPFKTPGGFLHIDVQLNDRTNLIQENKRFLFGNVGHWTGYRVIGTGINDFRNMKTYDPDSAKLLTLDLIADFVNDDLDDIVNGIADYYTNLYTVTISSSSIQGAIGDTFQLTEYILYNGHSASRTMEWTSSSNGIATVSDGLVTFISNGSCIITTNILDNTSASASCEVIVSASPLTNNEIIISPDTNYILEGMSRTYSVYLYENGTQQADTFTIIINSNDVPTTSYTFSQTGDNEFQITNILRDLESYLTVTCTTGSVVAPKTMDIYLSGAWLHAS